MVLVDTVVWIDHLRSNDEHLAMLLEREQIVMHPMVIGELALGNLANRFDTLEQFEGMPEISVATHDEVLFFIEHHQLMGIGIGYVDAHLLASAVLHGATQLWTREPKIDGGRRSFGSGILGEVLTTLATTSFIWRSVFFAVGGHHPAGVFHLGTGT